jgi:hypothetical protein
MPAVPIAAAWWWGRAALLQQSLLGRLLKGHQWLTPAGLHVSGQRVAHSTAEANAVDAGKVDPSKGFIRGGYSVDMVRLA